LITAFAIGLALGIRAKGWWAWKPRHALAGGARDLIPALMEIHTLPILACQPTTWSRRHSLSPLATNGEWLSAVPSPDTQMYADPPDIGFGQTSNLRSPKALKLLRLKALNYSFEVLPFFLHVLELG